MRVGVALILLAPVLSGCTREASVATSDLNLVALTGLFVNYLNTHHGESPKDEAAYKAFIAEKGEPAARLGWLSRAAPPEKNLRNMVRMLDK